MNLQISQPSPTTPLPKENIQENTQENTEELSSNSNPSKATLKVIKRDGSAMSFNPDKIAIAMTKAFLAVEGGRAAESSRVHDLVQNLTTQIFEILNRRLSKSGVVHIEEIQDQVELSLMRAGEHAVARDYVLYRESRKKVREQNDAGPAVPGILRVKQKDGLLKTLDTERLNIILTEACEGLSGVNKQEIFEDALRNLFEGIDESDVSQALVMSARTYVEKDPSYSFVTARLLMDILRTEALTYLNIASNATQTEMKTYYPRALIAFINQGIICERIDPRLKEFDLAKLGAAIMPERDLDFTYLGLQTLYDRYFIHEESVRYELPQVFFMRVAMGLAVNEPQKEEAAIEFYQVLSTFQYMASTPTLFNAGTTRPQLSSCFLTTIADDLSDIYLQIHNNAMLSKFAGGIGNDWTYVRGMNAYIKGTNGRSQGIIPFLKVANDTAVAVNQGGKRKGAVCAYLETWHIDIEEFLELRKNTGDDRRRTHDMNTANWIPDLFMKRVIEKGDWTLFTPNEAIELHDLYGDAFEKKYVEYEARAHRGEVQSKTMKAQQLWRKMLTMLFETGHPWLTFKDACNLRSPQQHCGVIHSSNLCTEITLNTSADEIAVCNLGSINLPIHMKDGQLDLKKLKKTIKTAIRMLDNVLEINYYTVPEARKSNLRHRPIGLGIMGFHDALYLQKLAYDTPEAISFADQSMEVISYYAIEASSDLAKERGLYDTFEGSLWSQGILPIDSINLLAKTRGQYLDQDTSQTLDWSKLRNKVRTQGMRNSNVMAIAPTATIANICGVSQSIEPTYQNLYVKSNMSGEFTVINPYLVDALKAKNLWDDVMINDLKYFDGSVDKIDRIPKEIKKLFATAFEIDCTWLIDAASRRQKWIDQAQSLNLYVKEPSGKILDQIYKHAWIKGLKTTYYLRSLAASSAEKSTIEKSELNAVKTEDLKINTEDNPVACSILNPDCEACQ